MRKNRYYRLVLLDKGTNSDIYKDEPLLSIIVHESNVRAANKIIFENAKINNKFEKPFVLKFPLREELTDENLKIFFNNPNDLLNKMKELE